MAYPVTKLDTVVELYTNTWTDITSYVLGAGDVTITRGANDELATLSASTCNFTLKNPAGRFSPRNPNSPYYGYIGKNTPVRVTVRPHWSTPLYADFADTFTRTESSYWGTPTSGQAYQYASSYGSSAGTDWQVNGSYGIHYVQASGYYWYSITTVSYLDVDVTGTCDTYISNVSGGDIEEAGIMLRYDYSRGSGLRCYLCRLEVDVNESMTAKIYLDGITLLASNPVTGFTWSGQKIGWRAQCVGNYIAYKVWDASGSEPDQWSVEVYNNDIYTEGTIGFRSGVNASNTNTKPVEFRWDDITAEHIYTRFVGEIPSLPVTWDTTGNDIRSAITASGITRRYNQGQKVPRCPVERDYIAHNCIFYWGMDDGATTQLGGSVMPESASMTAIISRMDFGKIAGPLGAPNNLPELTMGTSGATTPATAVLAKGVDSGTSWTIDVLFKGSCIPNSSLITWPNVFTWQDECGSDGTVMVLVDFASPSFYISTDNWDYGTGMSMHANLDFTDNVVLDDQWHKLRFELSQDTGTWIPTITISMDGYSQSTTLSGTLHTSRLKTVTTYTTSIGYAKSFAVGHLAVFAGTSGLPAMTDAMNGFQYDSVSTRVARIGTEDNTYTYVYDDGTSTLLTAQRTEATVTLLNDARTADQGILYETRNSRTYSYRALNNLLHQTPVTVSYSSFQLDASGKSSEFYPIDDDQRIWNDVTVERYTGSKYRLEDTTSPLNVSDPPTGVGRYDRGTLTTYAAYDSQLPDIAGWVLLRGTWDAARYPSIPIFLGSLHFTETQRRSLIELDMGDIISVTDTPDWIEPGDKLGMITGYTETLGNFLWKIKFGTVPGGPYYPALVGNDTYRVCADQDMVLAKAVALADTSIYVQSITGTQRWCHSTDDSDSASDYPMDIIASGEIMSATDCAYPLTDAFVRTAANWGNADTGQTWAYSASGNFSVADPYGIINPSVVSTDTFTYIDVACGNDTELYAATTMPNLTFTSSFRLGTVARYVDSSNYYFAFIQIGTTGSVALYIYKRVGGTGTSLGTISLPIVLAANEQWGIKFRVDGSTLKAKAWKLSPIPGSAEPDWQLDVTDTSLSSGSVVGCYARNNGSTTTASGYFTDLELRSPQKLAVTRGSRAGAHNAAMYVDVLNPAIVGWC